MPKLTATLLALAATCLAASVCLAGERRVLRAAASPDKKTVIVQENAGQGGRAGEDFYFEEALTHKKLGHVLPADQRGPDGATKVSVVASWNRDGSKVALLAFYGTKGSELLLFARDGAGQFAPVDLHEPDISAVYKQHTGHELADPSGSLAEDAVGPWLDDDTVRLVSGQTREPEGQGEQSHILVSYKAHIQGQTASISEVELHGPLSDEADTKFTKKWGTRYFEENDDN